ncbi:MAG: hypothetical protein ACREV4_09990 [Gammaproteobacteria bacterium]
MKHQDSEVDIFLFQMFEGVYIESVSSASAQSFKLWNSTLTRL